MAQAKKGKRSRRGRDDWRRLLVKLDRSDLGVTEFCRREGISAASLYRWRGLLGAVAMGDHGETAVSSKTPVFVDLGTLRSAGAATPRIELKLDLGDGLILHLVRH